MQSTKSIQVLSSWGNFAINLVGVVCVVYCFVMLLMPERLEDIAVQLVAYLSAREPRSSDYRFAWHVFSYSLVIAALVGAKSLVVWLVCTKKKQV